MPVFHSLTTAPRLLAAFGTLALLASAGLFASSRPAHTAGGPVPVTVANTSLAVTDAAAARQAVSRTLTLSGEIFTVPFGTLYTVPANKRLVIETMSAVSNRNDANGYTFFINTTEGGTATQTFFNLVPNGARYSAASQPMRLYVDPGSTIEIGAQNTGNNAPFVTISFSGTW